MKKLALSLLFSTSLVISNANYEQTNTNYKGVTLSPIICSSITAAGNTGDTVLLGQTNGNYINFTSDNANLTIESNNSDIQLSAGQDFVLKTTGDINLSSNSITPSLGDFTPLMINSQGNIFTATNTAPVTCGELVAGTSVLGNTSCGNLNATGLNISGPTTIGQLTAAGEAGQIIVLGNSTGSITLKGNNIIYPTNGNYSVLLIDSNGKLNTATTSMPFTCGSLNTTTFNSGNITTNNLNATGTTTLGGLVSGNTSCGNLSAATTNGQSITFGNSTGSINISGANIIKPTGNNYHALVIDSNGNIGTADSSSSFACNNLTTTTSNTNNLNTMTINATGSCNLNAIIAGNTTCGNFTAANNPGEGIILGNTTGTINISGKNITFPTANNTNLLMIDSNGNLQTSTPTNPFTCGSLTAAGTAGQTVTLGNSTGQITLIGTNIVNPLTSNNNLLSIDANGNIATAKSNIGITCGSLNASNVTCGNFTAANNAGQNIILGNSTGAISILSSDITLPIGENSILLINSSGKIVTGNLINFNCGNLTSANGTSQTVLIGNSSSNGNNINFTSDSGHINIQSNSTNGNIILNSANNNGYINLVSTGINPTNNSTGYTLLGISRINNVVTSDSANIFKIGNDANGKNYLSVDNNTTSNGILIQGNKISLNASTNPISLVSTYITKPNTGNNSLLMLNSSGNIITGNTTNSNLTCAALNATSLTTTGTLNAGASTLGNTTLGNLFCNNLIAGNTAGQTITLGNSTGAMTIYGTNIATPTTGNNSFLMLNSSNNLITANTTNSNLTCGALTASSLTTTGSLSCGNLTAGGTAGQTITLGNSTGAITISGTGITNPSTGNNSLLMIDSTGKINTILTSTPITCGNHTCANLTAAGGAGQTATLGNSTGSISVFGTNITPPTTGNNSFLMLNSSNNIITANTTNSNLTCAALNATSLTTTGTLNAGASTLGALTAGGTAGQNITLGNSTGKISAFATNIVTPTTGNNSFLMLNSSNNLITANTTNSNLTCGALTASSLSTTGTLNAGTTTVGTFTAGGTAGQTVTLGNSTGPIILQSSGITLPSTGNNSLLMIGSTGGLVTAGSTVPITCGSLTAADTTCNNLTAASTSGKVLSLGISSTGNSLGFTSDSGGITLQSICSGGYLTLNTNNNITISGGKLLLITSYANRPASGTLNLVIENSGAVSSVFSSAIYKDNIENLEINSDYFDLIKPVSFHYIKDEQKHLHYGFIAEDLEKIPTLDKTVIYGLDGNPLSINYQEVFVALTADYLLTKKTLKKELVEKTIALEELTTQYKNLENKVKNQEIILQELTEKINSKDTIINELVNKLKSLEKTIKKFAKEPTI